VVNLENPPANWQTWRVNAQRSALLQRYDLTHLRLHGSVDEICIFDDFAALLGLDEAVHVDGFIKIFEIPECSLATLTESVEDAMGMSALRIAGADDMGKLVRRVGLPWGGLGLFVNVGYQQQLIEQECDVFVAGESDNYGFRFAQECGIPMIETSHEICENPGLAHFTEMLARAFPQVAFRFFENPCVWKMHLRQKPNLER